VLLAPLAQLAQLALFTQLAARLIVFFTKISKQ
jgi:hypothetical protein